MSQRMRFPRTTGPALGYAARAREIAAQARARKDGRRPRPIGQYPQFHPSHSPGWHACLRRRHGQRQAADARLDGLRQRRQEEQ